MAEMPEVTEMTELAELAELAELKRDGGLPPTTNPWTSGPLDPRTRFSEASSTTSRPGPGVEEAFWGAGGG